MRLKLIFWHNEKHDEFHRRVIERIEFNSASRSSKRGNDSFEPVGRAVRNGNPKSDASAHRFLALLQRGQNALAIRTFDFAQANKQIDQLDDGRPTLGRPHLGDDLLGRK